MSEVPPTPEGETDIRVASGELVPDNVVSLFGDDDVADVHVLNRCEGADLTSEGLKRCTDPGVERQNIWWTWKYLKKYHPVLCHKHYMRQRTQP